MSSIRPMMFAAAQKIPRAAMISIIDDDESIREATRSLIRSLGYKVETFASAEEYLESARNTSCIITDVHMPGMTGVDLQDRLIADGDCAPIIFMSAYPEEKVRGRVMESGAIGFLNKPLVFECLIECLGKALKGSR
jgi:FixJ family two-component response regulator